MFRYSGPGSPWTTETLKISVLALDIYRRSCPRIWPFRRNPLAFLGMQKDLFLGAASTLFTVDIYINKSLRLQRKNCCTCENKSHYVDYKHRLQYGGGGQLL
jgi:hypothetical protein